MKVKTLDRKFRFYLIFRFRLKFATWMEMAIIHEKMMMMMMTTQSKIHKKHYCYGGYIDMQHTCYKIICDLIVMATVTIGVVYLGVSSSN